eukprot:4679800-Pleurochrysis_carterae.AAC.1
MNATRAVAAGVEGGPRSARRETVQPRPAFSSQTSAAKGLARWDDASVAFGARSTGSPEEEAAAARESRGDWVAGASGEATVDAAGTLAAAGE